MDRELIDILRQLRPLLGPEARAIIDGLLAGGGGSLAGPQLRVFLVELFRSVANRDLLRRLFVLMMRAGLLGPDAILSEIAAAEAIATASAAEAGAGVAGAEAGAAAAAAEGAGAGAGIAAAQLAIAIVAILLSAYIIHDEWTKELELGGAYGKPCGTGTPGGYQMATVRRTVTAWGWGQKTSLNRALARALDACNADAAKCGEGGCADGKTCQPTLAPLEVETRGYVVASWSRVVFTCPCVCG